MISLAGGVRYDLKGMRVIKKLCVAILSIWLYTSLAAANTVYVNCNSPNDPGSGTFGDPFRQIQSGINAAFTGDTVRISPGRYTGTGNYNLDTDGKSITLCSVDPNDSNVVADLL